MPPGRAASAPPTIHAFVSASDRFADGEITLEELKRTYWACKWSDPLSSPDVRTASITAAEGAVMGLSHNIDLGPMQSAVDAVVVESGGQSTLLLNMQLPPPEQACLTTEHEQQYAAAAGENSAQSDLLRDIFGNPFHPVTFLPEWRTITAVAIAQQMYDSRDFSAMPILADALRDAGCNNADILDHCRDEKQGHVRGCWVVDGVLNKS